MFPVSRRELTPVLCSVRLSWRQRARPSTTLHEIRPACADGIHRLYHAPTPTTTPTECCHFDRSAAKWRNPRIWLSLNPHNLGALPFAHFAKGGVSSSARQFSSTHHKFVISTGAQRSGEIPVLALSRIGTIWVPYPLRTLQRVGYREATALPTPPSPPPQPFSKSAHSQPAPVYWRMAESSTPHSTRFYEGPQ